jgi:hypothetical protein
MPLAEESLSTSSSTSSLEDLYWEMYELTRDHCGCEGQPFHCCTKEYCFLAAGFSLLNYGISLSPTGHPIPFMSEKGCIVPPHLRPICTLHACHISWRSGEFPNDLERTRQYRALKDKIESEARRLGLWPLT